MMLLFFSDCLFYVITFRFLFSRLFCCFLCYAFFGDVVVRFLRFQYYFSTCFYSGFSFKGLVFLFYVYEVFFVVLYDCLHFGLFDVLVCFIYYFFLFGFVSFVLKFGSFCYSCFMSAFFGCFLGFSVLCFLHLLVVFFLLFIFFFLF